MIKKVNNASVSAVVSLLLSWSIGLLIITNKHYITSPWEIWGIGVLNILLLVGFINLLFVPLSYFWKKSKILLLILHIIFSLLILTELVSLFYFSITLNLLSKFVFEFPIDQAFIILDSYFVFKGYYLLLPFPFLCYVFLYRLKIIKNEKWVASVFITLGLLSLFFSLQIEKSSINYSELSKNKAIYLVQSFSNKEKHQITRMSKEEINFYQNNVNPSLRNKTHILYHQPSDSNPLSPFFNLQATPPNLVFIVVEGLSSSYSGPNADEISFTPFLDSLANHSLYFDNSLATSERSFAALPSIIGSLPHGKRGFTSSSTGYPRNETLAKWLFKNGYKGDFFYGGYARFDNMDLFMHNQGFRKIHDHKKYSYEGTGLQTSIDEVPFGINDRQLFEEIIEITDKRKNYNPFFDVYFTVSMHYPYNIENNEEYLQQVNEIITKAKVDENIKRKTTRYQKELATFLYSDNAMRNYFKEQEKREAHQNTIYVIVGDHMMNEIAQSSHIEKYRSAMMIYSPLLKKNKRIKGVNSHLDIAPSIYNLIQQEYQFPALDSVSWLGHPFDTSATFNSERNVLLMLYVRGEVEMVHKNYFLAKNQLFKLSDRLKTEPVEDKAKKEFMDKLIKTSKAVHQEVVENNLLIPNPNNTNVFSLGTKEFVITASKEFYFVYNTVLEKPSSEIQIELEAIYNGDWIPNDSSDVN